MNVIDNDTDAEHYKIYIDRNYFSTARVNQVAFNQAIATLVYSNFVVFQIKKSGNYMSGPLQILRATAYTSQEALAQLNAKIAVIFPDQKIKVQPKVQINA